MESADALMEEQKLMTEAKYRNYMSNIEKALRSFEYSSEWADLISALGKLSKAISSNTQYQVIPRRIKISKRLAQCMHPALPSGVHLKALETYAVIFAKTGPERLATELFIYSAGLFPLLGYAAMNVRPTLLGIYETYFVPLGEKLRPALSGFLSGVLPGYESGLDHFERTNSLLNHVCIAVNPTHFYTVLWECIATNASIRLPAITYLLEHFNKRLGMQEQVFIMGHNREIMMSALCACLNDAVILVQRNTLEFLLLGFPMHTVYLTETDLIKLVTNGLNTILRRDMSLNRRLYSWLLGSEVAKNSPPPPVISDATDCALDALVQSYFERYSKRIVTQALICTLRFSLECTPVDLKPYRIMVSLLDKAEIGSAVLDFVLCDVIRTMTLSNGNKEVIKSANLLFATFDPAYIWSFMTGMYEKSCRKANKNKATTTTGTVKLSRSVSHNCDDIKFQCKVGAGDPCLVEICYLTEFLLETISLEMYNETTRIYLPKVFLAITQMLTRHLEHINSDEVMSSLKLCMKIVSRVQPMITSPIKLIPRASKNHGYCSSSDEKSVKDAILKHNATAGFVNTLEKSKSDSKLNKFGGSCIESGVVTGSTQTQDALNGAVSRETNAIRRSNSNQHMERKSPKKKKAKSYSKLSELDKEICPDTGQLIDPSSSDLDTPLSIKKLKSKAKAPYMRIRTSPKKLRPKHMPIAQPKSLDQFLLKTNNDQKDLQPKSASSKQQLLQREHVADLLFNYQENGNGVDALVVDDDDEEGITAANLSSAKEFSILEKCIRQYEIFFEIYIAYKVLQIKSCFGTPVLKANDDTDTTATCRINVLAACSADNVVANDDLQLHVESIFENETVYEHKCQERLLEIDKLFDTLRVNVLCRSKQLQCLLNRSLVPTAADSTSDFSDAEFLDCISNADQLEEKQQQQSAAKYDAKTERAIQTLIDLRLNGALRNAIKLASNLLVEMSTFPNCNKNIVLDKMEHELPSWLKVLCLMAAYTKGDRELQLSAVTTLFDLISLLKSQIEHTTSPGVTFVVMLPLLKFGHVSYIEHKTRIFQLIISTLWNYMGQANVDPAQITALLYQLHNCLESGLVETIVGNRMYTHSMQQQFAAVNVLMQESQKEPQQRQLTAMESYQHELAREIQLMCVSPMQHIDPYSIKLLEESESSSFKKFELLWHLGRDKQPSRGFEKTLLKVLDTLALPHYMSVRTMVTKWLQSALLRGDLSRLIKPLYKILLTPNSKRVNIPHLHLLRKEGGVVDGDATAKLCGEDIATSDAASRALERDVYAISSEFGNIKYHMDASNGGKKRSPIRTFHKKIFGVTLSSKNKTSNFVSDKVPPTAITATDAMQDAATIGLIINPLDVSPDFDEETSEQQQQQKMQNEDVVEELKIVKDDAMEVQNDEQDYTDESDSSIFDSESENRETSVEKDDSLTISSSAGVCSGNGSGTSLKRFVGDCEQPEILWQHERTKNRKTYRLSREKTPGALSSASITNEQNMPKPAYVAEDAAHPAEEYFSGNTAESSWNGEPVEIFVKELMEQVTSTSDDLSKVNDLVGQKKKQRRSPTTSQTKKSSSAVLKKSTSSIASSGEKKRLSCISKTSTDSNNSVAGGTTTGPQSLQEESVINLAQSDDELATSPTINVEDKRRNLSLETCKTKRDWELSQETLEKSKQNLQILRQNNAAANAAAGGNMVDTNSKRSSTKSGNSSSADSRKLPTEKLNFFHNHMLAYLDIYDTKQTLYAFQTLRNIIACDTRTFLCLSITTSLSSSSLKQLLIRHRKSIAGKGFTGSITNSEFAQNYRGCMHLEVLVTICLYYARGFFFNRESSDVDGGTSNDTPTLEDITGNCRVQLESIELLTLICSELIDIVKGMGKGLACYIADLMARCKLQKVILHCLNSAVNAYVQHYRGDTLAEQILNFNNPQDEHLHADSFQIQLLRLLMAIIKLEYEVVLLKNDVPVGNVGKEDSGGNVSPTRLSNIAADGTVANVKYLPNCVISQQPMFLAAVLSALQDERLRHLHRNWADLVTSSLNCFRFGSLTNIVISVVHQLCNNIDGIIKLSLKEQCGFPPDYVISQLEAITILCHYCLLDNTQQTTLSHLFNQAYPQTSVASQSSNTGQLLNNIVHSFLSSAAAAGAQSDAQAPRNPRLLAARNAVLSHLSRIVASVATVWDSELGQVRQVKQQLMEFLSPVSLHHGANFLAAVAVTWQERGEQHRKRESAKNMTATSMLSVAEQYQRNSTPQASPSQLSLVTLVSSIRVMPMDSFVQTLHQVIKSPPPIHRPPIYLTIEVSALELFYFYMKSAPVPQLGDSWSSFLALLRDGLSLTPPAQFTLLMLLNEFVQRCPQMPFQDKKDIRDLHDVTSRLVESLSNVAGSCLEQTTWLRRNLAVKEDLSPITPDGGMREGSISGVSSGNGNGGLQQYAVQAQSVLAAVLVNLLDVAYGSQEKDKVVTIVTALLYNITPYLKNHTARNIPSFYACSSLLANLSLFQYTRKAWRKDMFDLLLDNSFFQMDISCLPFWKQIMDSLMCYDNTTFRELMSRVSLTQTGSLNIFTSREQEYEQRAMLLKRLAFVIFCSQSDQYDKYMPEVQEQLTNSLRLLSMVPSVQAAVFLCFRVLLLRMSPDHVTSLWPIIIAEMVQVFLAMEQELKADSEDLSQQMRLLAGADSSWSSNSSSGNGLHSQNHLFHWRSVQLEASKLLELGCVLPATYLPHFQMYRWAFVGTEFDAHEEVPITNGISDADELTLTNTTTAMLPASLYVPHVRRIARLMDMKYAVHSPTNLKRGQHLVLTYQQINMLQDLYGFFSTLSVNCPNPRNYADTELEVASCLTEIEAVLAKDFLEKMPTSTTPR